MTHYAGLYRLIFRTEQTHPFPKIVRVPTRPLLKIVRVPTHPFPNFGGVPADV